MNMFNKIESETPAYGRGVCRLFLSVGAILFLAALNLFAQIPPGRPNNDNEKREPFRLIGNIYWVGHTQTGSFLITTPQGHILMDTTSTEESPWVRENIEKLGFKVRDIKIILNSHPHEEHMGGFAMFKELTGAKIIASAATAAEMAVGGRTDFREDGSEQYKPIKADEIIANGGEVRLGGMVLKAYITPGHTKGCTTWTTTVEDAGKKYNALFFCGMAPAGTDRAPLLNNPKYPDMSEDFANAFKLLKSLPCDVYLYARAPTIRLNEKQQRLNRGEKPNPFIDPAGCKEYIAEYEKRYLDQLAEERKGR